MRNSDLNSATVLSFLTKLQVLSYAGLHESRLRDLGDPRAPCSAGLLSVAEVDHLVLVSQPDGHLDITRILQ